MTLAEPETVRSNGAVLRWSAYTDPSTSPSDDVVEYQVFRGCTTLPFPGTGNACSSPVTTQLDTSASSKAQLVGSVAKDVLAWADTSAVSSSTEDVATYRYWVVARTAADVAQGRNGTAASGGVLVTTPLDGRTRQTLSGDLPDATISSAFSETPEGAGPLRVGPKQTRALVEFDTSAVPAGSRVLSSRIDATVVPGSVVGKPGSVQLHGLTKDFAEASATWNMASSTIPWSTAGGDVATSAGSASASSLSPTLSWTGTALNSLVQSWVTDTASNHGVRARLADESGVVYSDGTMSTSGSTAKSDQQSTQQAPTEPCIVECQTPTPDPSAPPPALKLVAADAGSSAAQRPRLTIEYASRDASAMFSAPEMPERLVPNTTTTVPVRVLNTSTTAWPATMELGYRWGAPGAFAAPSTTAAEGVVALGRALAAGESVTVQLPIKAPINSDAGNKRLTHDLLLDLRNAGAWWSATSPAVPAAQSVRPPRGCGITTTGFLCVDRVVEDPSSDGLGLEKFGSFTGEATGQGSQVLVNLASGNAVFAKDLLANPSVGPSTFVRMTYNSNDVSDAGAGFGYSIQASTLTRLGSRLSVPNGNSTAKEMSFIDGDGTTHYYRIDELASTATRTVYTRPAGVHLTLHRDKTAPDATQWVFTRPDGTRFFYAQSTGLPTSVVDINGNTMRFTHDADGRLISLIDAKGQVTLTLGWDAKRGSKTGRLQWIRDISGRGIVFSYTDTLELKGIQDGGGFNSTTGLFAGKVRSFGFGYATEPVNKHARLVTVTDPRANISTIAYWAANDDPSQSAHHQGWVKQLTDRNGQHTTFAYSDPDGNDGNDVAAEVTDLNGTAGSTGAVVTSYRMDGFGRTTMIRHANANAGVGGADTSTVTRLAWDADNNVHRLTAPNGAVSTWEYDPITGYPKVVRSPEAVKNGTDGTVLTYAQLSGAGTPTVLTKVTSPMGRASTFGHDARGNLISVTDPLGRASAYTLNADGTLAADLDARQNKTTLLDYHPSGQPKRVVDALGNASTFVYDSRGNLMQATDPLLRRTTVEYDDFGRSTKVTSPDQAVGQTRTQATSYDDNDNVERSIAPTGATTINTHSRMDEVLTTALPANSAATSSRTLAYAYDAFGRLISETAPKGTATADPDDFVTRYVHDRIGQVLRTEQPFKDGIDGAGTAKLAVTSYTYDLAGNVTKVVDPNKVASSEDDYSATMTYDLDGQLLSSTDAAGYTTKSGYDRDGNVTTQTDAIGNVKTLVYDAAGQVVRAEVPRADQVLVTSFGYDAAGNRERVTRPSGRVERTIYDALNRAVENVGASDSSVAYGKPARTYIRYDAAGQVSKQSDPTFLEDPNAPGVNWTAMAYWPSGDIKTTTDPWGIQAGFDYNKLGQQTRRTLSVAAAADPHRDSATREMTWAFWPDGSLRERTDAGAHPAQVADNTGAFVAAKTTWVESTAVGQQGDNVQTHAAGGADAAVWRISPDVAGTYDLRVTCPKVTGAATNATFTIKVKKGDATTTTTKVVDQTACQSGTVAPLLGSFTFAGGEDIKVSLAPSATGVAVADAIKLRKTDSSAERRVFSYAYDANGQVETVTDGAKSFTTKYDGLGRALKATETGGATGTRTTTWAYDLSSNMLSSYAFRGAGDGSENGNNESSRFTRYTWDIRDMVASVAAGATPDASLKTTTFGYDPRGMRVAMTKPNGNVTSYAYYSDGLPRSITERDKNAKLVASHDLEFTLDGDRSKDVSKVENPDTDGYLNQVATFAYTPSRQLASVNKTVPDAASGKPGKGESYCYDAAGNITEQKVGRDLTRMTYDRNRLLKTQTKKTDVADLTCPTGSEQLETARSTLTHQYDAFGRATTLSYQGGTGTRANGTVVKRYGYDGFDRVVREQSFLSDGDTNDTTITRTYDAFDRTTHRTATVRNNPAVSTRYVYLGKGDQVAFEEQRDTGGAWQLAKAYTYGPGGEQLAMRDIGVNVPGPDATESTDPDKQLDAGESRELFFGTNPHGDIETLTDNTGEVVSSYRYTAYGSADQSGSLGIDAPDTETPEDAQAGDEPEDAPHANVVNPYRFNGKRYDGASGSYDMGFRDYDPGLNRYTSRDMYNGALSDVALGMDPWNTNRYAFAGGNPVTGVELDGHQIAPLDGGGGSNSTGVSVPEDEPEPEPEPEAEESNDDFFDNASFCLGPCTSGPLPLKENGELDIETVKQTSIFSAVVTLSAAAVVGCVVASAGCVAGGAALADGAAMSSGALSSGTVIGSSAVVGSRIVGSTLDDAVRGVAPVLSKPSARVLGANMEAAGVPRPSGSAAHHIVAGSSAKASEARSVLQRFGIDINDANNGVFLPGSSASPNPTGAAVHSKTHTNAYYSGVNSLLSQATTRTDALDALGYVSSKLSSGGFP
ncbi:AHH domain-containing protein [Nocardioides sp.]|uniref:golvesin C-terminal-like domain-containing protein n=1 Tax=Nocardioides sp. TaxID=35761 RepID=UPI002B7EC492|nr:AHH domain-containing protein [Nocardioides sp.]HXH80276.1 AHH domain-containing protein [Nocardioides sp.]